MGDGRSFTLAVEVRPLQTLDQEYEGLEDWSDEPALLADALRDALDDGYSDAGPDEMDDALGNVLDSMSAAEAFNFAKALKQIETGARQAFSDPVVGQIVRTALPIAGGVVGTAIGGPLGTRLGSDLGNAAARALPGAPRAAPAAPVQAPGLPAVAGGLAAAAPVQTPAQPPVAGGSAAAAQGLVLTQQPEVLKGLLALALGQHGQKSVNGVPVAQIMSMLSSVFGQAAADADELMYLEGEGMDEGGDVLDDAVAPSDRSLYAALLDAESDELGEALVSP